MNFPSDLLILSLRINDGTGAIAMSVPNVRTAETCDGFDIMLAGHRVPAGTYLELDNGREVVVEAEGGVLPAGFDGKVAAYIRRPLMFGELIDQRKKQAV